MPEERLEVGTAGQPLASGEPSCYTVSRLRPFALRRLRTLRPPLVAMRLLKPCVFFLRRTLGWNVRFIDPTSPFLAPPASTEPGQCRHRLEASQSDDLPCDGLWRCATLRLRCSTGLSNVLAQGSLQLSTPVDNCVVSGGSVYADQPLGPTHRSRFPSNPRHGRRFLGPSMPPGRARGRPPENQRAQSLFARLARAALHAGAGVGRRRLPGRPAARLRGRR